MSVFWDEGVVSSVVSSVLGRFEHFFVGEFYVYLGGDSFLKRVAKFGEVRNSSDLM